MIMITVMVSNIIVYYHDYYHGYLLIVAMTLLSEARGGNGA